MITDVDELELPGWLRSQVLGATRSEVRAQRFLVGHHWWAGRLHSHELDADLFPTEDGWLSRQQLFDLGTKAAESGQAARTLLWAACAWGTGDSQRGNGRRIRGVAGDPDEFGELLRAAAAMARQDAEAAYGTLRIGRRNLVPGLGPAFFTKFLYFAGEGADAHPCQILDARVARRLRWHCGWDSLTGTTGWPETTYARYARLLSRWAAELSAESGRQTVPDEFEYQLFNGPVEPMRN